MSTGHDAPSRRDKVTIRTIQRMKQAGETITCLTAYDALMARLLDRSGVDLMRSLIELEFVIEIVNNRDPATIQTKLYGLLDIDPDGFQ